MFTHQAASMAQQLIDVGMPANQATVLMSVLGNCVADLLHRGGVTIVEEPNPNVPVVSIPDIVTPPTGADPVVVNPDDPAQTWPPSTVTIIGGGTYNPTANTIDDGGFAINVRGPALFNFLFVTNTFNFGGYTYTASPQGEVKTSSTDSLDYLEDQFFDITNVAPTAGLEMPIPVYSDGDQLRVRIKPADITPSYSGGVVQLLGHDSSGLWKWYSVTVCP